MPGTPARQAVDALQQFRSNMKSVFIERDEVIDGLLTALVAKENAFMLGPPGTAKSALVTTMSGSITGSACFTRLLTKFSTPEELFGPISLAKLEQDEYCRKTEGYLPSAHFGFVDEIFKANSAILNSLLTLANERMFDNNGKRESCPLFTLVGASNELPEDKGLDALFDRFMLRYWVGYINDRDKMIKLLKADNIALNVSISLDQVKMLQKIAHSINVPDSVFESILEIKSSLESEGIFASDRTWRKLIHVIRSYALLNGEYQNVQDEHLEILSDCIWREPSQRSVLVRVVGKVANPTFAELQKLLDTMEKIKQEFPASVDIDSLALASIKLKDANKVAERAVKIANDTVGKGGKVKDTLDRIESMATDMNNQVARASNVNVLVSSRRRG